MLKESTTFREKQKKLMNLATLTASAAKQTKQKVADDDDERQRDRERERERAQPQRLILPNFTFVFLVSLCLFLDFSSRTSFFVPLIQEPLLFQFKNLHH